MIKILLCILGAITFLFLVVIFSLLMLKFIIWFGGKVLKIEGFK